MINAPFNRKIIRDQGIFILVDYPQLGIIKRVILFCPFYRVHLDIFSILIFYPVIRIHFGIIRECSIFTFFSFIYINAGLILKEHILHGI